MKAHIRNPLSGRRIKPLLIGGVSLLAVALACVLTAAMPDRERVSFASGVETQMVCLSNPIYQMEETRLTSESLVSTVNITDNRAVTVKCDGDTRTIFTAESTVGEVLEEMEIRLGAYDTVSPDLDSSISEGTLIRISRAKVVYETEFFDIPYETIRTEDPAMEDGTEVVTQQGKNGKGYDCYQVILREDEEPEYIRLSSAVQEAPVAEEVTYGTYIPNSLITPSGERVYYSRVLTCTATAYTDESGQPTATGTTPRVGAIAVDPRVIPYGTRMYIVTEDGSIVYGYATAEDCGGAIKGNRVDLYYDTEAECVQFGRRAVLVYILED